MKIALVIALFFFPTLSFADKFSSDASYKICFTPAQHCTDLIISTIANAQNQVLVQAYSFTSAPIAKALIQAHKRGVEVKVILDKSQFKTRGFSSAKFFTDYHLPLLVDYKPSIAHNKVMIIDKKTVITGSFNFTRAAEERNAENLIIITDAELAKRYAHNWELRAIESRAPATGGSPFE
ncbi:MAG: phospholipase D family protein [Gammaproteobacteria bacterium]|nr:phospholipase D family protein [Gammaproteobacteria bacterium]